MSSLSRAFCPDESPTDRDRDTLDSLFTNNEAPTEPDHRTPGPRLDAPETWPLFPVLPLIRHGGGLEDLGYLVAYAGPVVYVGSIYDAPAFDSIAEYTSFDALAAEWRVD